MLTILELIGKVKWLPNSVRFSKHQIGYGTSFTRTKQLWPEDSYSPPYTAEVKNECRYICCPLCPHVVQRDKFVDGVNNMDATSTSQITASPGLCALKSQIKPGPV